MSLLPSRRFLTVPVWLRMAALFAAIAAMLCMPATARTEAFPQRPLTMLIGFNPGGSTDIQGRVLADIMADELGQPIDLIYYPGMGGANAAAMLGSSQDEGHVFKFGLSLPFFFTPLIMETSFILNDFRFVGAVSLDQSALVTGPDTPFSDWASMLDYAHEQGELIYATQNTQDLYIMQIIAEREGINLRTIPTSGGGGMAPLIVSGDAEVAFSGGTHSAYTDSGDMRVLASLADERLRSYPQAPTVRELGYDLSMHAYRILAVPANTPDHQITRLADALKVATEHPDFIRTTEDHIQMPIVFLEEAELTRQLQTQAQAYFEMMQRTGIPGE